MTNQEIAKIFDRIADILEIQGEIVFKIRAYRKAVEIISGYAGDLSKLSTEELQNLPGIGEAIAKKIKELAQTGRLHYYDELKKSEYAQLVNLLSIPGVGPKHARLVYDQLGVKDIPSLEKACRDGKLKSLFGLGEKTQEKILKGIESLRKHKERFPIGEIYPKVLGLVEKLDNLKDVKKILLGGSLRRMKETIADVDILVAASESENIVKTFVNLPEVSQVLAQGETKSSIVTKDGFQVDLRIVPLKSFGAAAQYFTGSKSHNVKLRTIAEKAGLKLNEYGIFKGNKKIAGETEEGVYKTLGLAWMPPELREDTGEIEAAFENKLPRLIELKDIQGDLHIHTTWSDGKNSLEEMAQAGYEMGYQYIAICDHSRAVGIAGGMEADKVLKQIEAIKKLNKKYKNFRILAGIEVDILSDNKLDLPDSVLKQLDLVVAAVHTKFTQTKEEMTGRIIKALEHPLVHILAHPTGRLLGKRDPYEVDLDKILDCAKNKHKVIELNACPERLDLNDIYLRKAKEKNVKIVISTDSHHKSHLKEWMPYGIATARRGWLEKEDVVNTYNLEKLLKYFKK